MFRNVIVRRPSRSMIDGITTADLGKPDYELALRQHDAYIEAMRACGAEAAVRGLPIGEAVGRIGRAALEDVHPRSSWRASKEFRLQLVEELSGRALGEAARKGGAQI